MDPLANAVDRLASDEEEDDDDDYSLPDPLNASYVTPPRAPTQPKHAASSSPPKSQRRRGSTLASAATRAAASPDWDDSRFAAAKTLVVTGEENVKKFAQHGDAIAVDDYDAKQDWKIRHARTREQEADLAAARPRASHPARTDPSVQAEGTAHH